MVCSRGESFSTHMNQMKLFTAIAAAVVLGGTFIFTNRRTFDEFARALSAFCGGSCRPFGPSVRLES